MPGMNSMIYSQREGREDLARGKSGLGFRQRIRHGKRPQDHSYARWSSNMKQVRLWARASTVKRGLALRAKYRLVRHRLTVIGGNPFPDSPCLFLGFDDRPGFSGPNRSPVGGERIASACMALQPSDFLLCGNHPTITKSGDANVQLTFWLKQIEQGPVPVEQLAVRIR